MTFDHDPPRWTSSPELAPEELRGPLAAAANEGPNALQMKSLALKLAAISAGTAVAASAATAKAAATTASGAKAAGALTLTKALTSLAIVGAVGTSVAIWQHGREQPLASQHRETGAAPATHTASAPTEPTQPAQAAPHAAERTPGAPAPQAAPAQLPVPTVEALPQASERAEPVEAAPEPAAQQPESQPEQVAPGHARKAQAHTQARVSRREGSRERGQAKHVAQSAVVAKSAQVPSEVELLRGARAALASQPRTAYALTEEHRARYPRGVFAQERDALAIEALLRAGDNDKARELAQRFIRDYPASPHAHRFRETMGL
jgi:hypothetical protein